MLMNAVTVINTPMDFIGTRQNDITATDGINVIFHTERNVSVQIDVKLIKIVDMIVIVMHVVNGGMVLTVLHLCQKVVCGRKKGD